MYLWSLYVLNFIIKNLNTRKIVRSVESLLFILYRPLWVFAFLSFFYLPILFARNIFNNSETIHIGLFSLRKRYSTVAKFLKIIDAINVNMNLLSVCCVNWIDWTHWTDWTFCVLCPNIIEQSSPINESQILIITMHRLELLVTIFTWTLNNYVLTKHTLND